MVTPAPFPPRIDDSEVVAFNFDGAHNCLYIIANLDFVDSGWGNPTPYMVHTHQVYVLDLTFERPKITFLESGIEFYLRS